MTDLLVRWFIRDKENINDTKVRQSYGRLSGFVGICCNVLLFALKLIAGLATGAVSIMADAFNNLSDAASSVVTLIGFYMAGKPADLGHPYGHGRIEYLSGLFIAAAILMTGVELMKSSVEKIIHPETPDFSAMSIVILVISILLKMWMAGFNSKLGKRIQSEAMKATAADSLSDCISTSAVLIGVFVAMVTGKNLDGWIGALVALFVCFAGFSAAKDTIQPLLGQAPDPELVKRIRERVLKEEKILGVHDLVVHDYGPGRRMISLHAEISYKEDILEAHDLIDNIERNLMKEFQCSATIHMDPVVTDDEEMNTIKKMVEDIVTAENSDWRIHDFRIVQGSSHTNLIFDLVVTPEELCKKQEIERWVKEKIHDADASFYAVVTVEQSFI